MPLYTKLLSREGFLHAFGTRDEQDADLAPLVGAESIVRVKQVHGGRAVEAAPSLEAEADAIVARGTPPAKGGPEGPTSQGRMAVGVRVADCASLLLADPASGDVAAVHVGWRGVVAQVVPATLDLLAPGGRVLAAIGPCIGACCFEVGRDVAEEIARACGDARVVVWTSNDKAYVDLRGAVRAQLLARGVGSGHIDDVPGCTKHEPERFHSHRRDGERSGRMLAAIAARR